MIRKILIANRGEIACRIIRTARRLNIKTVAIYSEIDKSALHVTMADEAYCVGPAAAKESYLNISNIIDILKKSKADAVHPGYGFLSENAEFAEAVTAIGVIFIGPSFAIIRDMGDKLRAKELARAAGISLIPGSLQPVTTLQAVEDFAKSHAFPLLLKAAAGGGGKGMRVVRTHADISEALDRTQSEALSSFGDARVFIEKYIEHPRHVEVQILGDIHGTLLHLGIRDCSLQRRHQKVVEETPAPHLAPDLHDKIIAEALKIAHHIGYVSAGTVEFVVAPDHQFYFLEVNTRLQVEHPVTESIYGLDLVELMIRVAQGEKLALFQENLKANGHAIEVRLYAEDADNDFLPSSGRLVQYHHPQPAISFGTSPEDKEDGEIGGAEKQANFPLRIDSGVREGDSISIYYDPMIAKVIVHATDRESALNLMQDSLSQFIVEGIDCNINYLQRLLADPDVAATRLSTNLIEEKAEELSLESNSFFRLPQSQQEQIASIALTLKLAMEPSLQSEKHWICTTSNAELKVSYLGAGRVSINEKSFETEIKWLHQRTLFECRLNNQRVIGKVHAKGGKFLLTVQGRQFHVFIEREHIWNLLKNLPQPHNNENVDLIRSPMPGILLSLHVAVGDKVKRGQPIAVIEAMKMENTLKAPIEGTIAEITAVPGMNLLKSQLIARFEVSPII
ncbi:acetyl/propionyl/methylcrotonyl-CoA carboxylase subunit alpha [Candidatus Paracaedibacter symbiosus]|uniref:acetyl/propionyl/methylcrotonyl-CoA carboxylase subunit alpha n=1 Tax=Candidatus Paracaedibacter symbiosus TaxID=244582 RepID=UPI000509A7E8|nr:biotin carboxylase N-terminal domain-containing protein [Candidatus Paracaedibacter symbiosus]